MSINVMKRRAPWEAPGRMAECRPVAAVYRCSLPFMAVCSDVSTATAVHCLARRQARRDIEWNERVLPSGDDLRNSDLAPLRDGTGR